MNSNASTQAIPQPRQAEEMISLAEKILSCHQYLGTESPMKVQMIADLNYKCGVAKAKHEEAMKYKKLMEEAMIERDQLLGLKSAPSASNSISNSICLLVEILQSTQSADRLTAWGFQVSKA